MVIDERGVMTFASGKIRRANRGIVGLMRGGVITEGYDGVLWDRESECEMHDEPGDPPLSEADLIELAEYMQGQWRGFAEKVRARRVHTGTHPVGPNTCDDHLCWCHLCWCHLAGCWSKRERNGEKCNCGGPLIP